MPIHFILPERIIGSALETGRGGDQIRVLSTELLGPSEATYMTARLESLQDSVFRHIPGLPDPSKINRLLVSIDHDLRGVAYVDEFPIEATVRLNHSVEAGHPLRQADIAGVTEVRTGIELGTRTAIISVASIRWKRSLYYDLTPLGPPNDPRPDPIERVLAHQIAMLLGVAPETESGQQSIYFMESGIAELNRLLIDRCTDESAYQEVLQRHQWMFGHGYSSVTRHQALDDQQIPDFTAKRSRDGASDLFELKQPFLSLFKKNGEFHSNFNAAWGQCERYLIFTEQQRSYLLATKGLRFENPRCFLIAGYQLDQSQQAKIAAKQSLTRGIELRTYDQILQDARSIHALMSRAAEPVSVLNPLVLDQEAAISQSTGESSAG